MTQDLGRHDNEFRATSLRFRATWLRATWLSGDLTGYLFEFLQLCEVFGSGECPIPLHLRVQSGHRSKKNRCFHVQTLPVQFHWHSAASPSATRFSLSITAKLNFCPGNYIIFMILDINLSLDPFPLTGEEVETKRNLPQRKSEQIRYRTSRETKNVDRNTHRPQSM